MPSAPRCQTGPGSASRSCRRCGAYWKAVDEEHPEAARKGLPPRILYGAYTYPLDYLAGSPNA